MQSILVHLSFIVCDTRTMHARCGASLNRHTSLLRVCVCCDGGCTRVTVCEWVWPYVCVLYVSRKRTSHSRTSHSVHRASFIVHHVLYIIVYRTSYIVYRTSKIRPRSIVSTTKLSSTTFIVIFHFGTFHSCTLPLPLPPPSPIPRTLCLLCVFRLPPQLGLRLNTHRGERG